jgi:predicted ATP-dependent endonuclease of OLD family
MELIEVNINSYKVLKDFKINFLDVNGNPKKVVAIAGINGSGKTSLLEYISKKLKDESFDRKGSVKVLTEFDSNKGEHRLLKSIKSIKIDSPLLKSISEKEYSGKDIVYFDSRDELQLVEKEKVDLFKDVLSDIGKFVIYLQTDRFKFKDINNLLFHYVNEIVFGKNEKPEIAYEFVREIIKDIFQDFDLRFEFGSVKTSYDSDNESFHVFFRNEFSDRIQLNSLSTGEKELITKVFYLEILRPKEAIVLIDEPERSLHPKWQQKMVGVYERLSEKYGCQFIIATHSPHIISSLKPENVYLLGFHEKENNRIDVVNLDQLNKNSLGLEPNRILKEVMGVSTLRFAQVENKISQLMSLLNVDSYTDDQAKLLIEELDQILGGNDPFMIRVRHQIKVLDRKKLAKV